MYGYEWKKKRLGQQFFASKLGAEREKLGTREESHDNERCDLRKRCLRFISSCLEK